MNKRQRDRWIYSSLLILCIVGFWIFDNFYIPGKYSAASDDAFKTEVPSFFMPSSTSGQMVRHNHYSLSYSEAHEQAEWVVYTLNKIHLTYDERKRPYFIEDPYLSSKSADWRNYKGSGYDRGHLCPAGDRSFSELAYRETFYTSNISPQNPEFNAGIWNDLEKQVRIWGKRYNQLFIATAGVLENDLKTIGDEDVAVPRYYYKIVFRGTVQDPEVIAFLIPNRPGIKSLENYVVSVDRIEEMTGINFFDSLPEELEQKIEAGTGLNSWRFISIR
ncbi:MAG: DNA/RNA non-specific endonuclease [Flavobacteriaceae bacterium]